MAKVVSGTQLEYLKKRLEKEAQAVKLDIGEEFYELREASSYRRKKEPEKIITAKDDRKHPSLAGMYHLYKSTDSYKRLETKMSCLMAFKISITDLMLTSDSYRDPSVNIEEGAYLDPAYVPVDDYPYSYRGERFPTLEEIKGQVQNEFCKFIEPQIHEIRKRKAKVDKAFDELDAIVQKALDQAVIEGASHSIIFNAMEDMASIANKFKKD